MKAHTPVIPTAALEQHVVVLGKTRSGKSSVMRGMVEDLLDRGHPVCIVDPKGDWWGIKRKKDGIHPAYPVVIFGGEHADVPINAHAGAAVAELYATDNRPCLIDLGGWTIADRTRFWIDFAGALFKLTRGLRWLVVDEAHNFAPKGKIMDPAAGMALHWANRLASEGLGKGLRLILASQRPQKVHNDTLTSCETLIAMRMIHKSDRDAVADWIDGCGDMSVGKTVLANLANMTRGEAFAWSPEIGFGPERVKFPLFNTYDSFRPQNADDVKKTSGVDWVNVDLEAVRTKLANVVKEAEQNDPKALKRRIAELERDAKKHTSAHTAEDLEAEYRRGHEDGYHKCCRAASETFAAIRTPLNEIARRLDEGTVAIGPVTREWGASPIAAQAKVEGEQKNAQMRGALDTLTIRRPLPFKTAATETSSEVGNGGMRRILIALAQRPNALTKSQIGVRAGLSSTSGTFGTYLAKARAAGWIETSSPGLLFITEAGRKALGNYEPLPTGRGLFDYWMNELGNSGAARILSAVYYARDLPREVAADRANISPTSGTFGTYLAKLRKLELIKGGSTLEASAELYD